MKTTKRHPRDFFIPFKGSTELLFSASGDDVGHAAVHHYQARIFVFLEKLGLKIYTKTLALPISLNFFSCDAKNPKNMQKNICA